MGFPFTKYLVSLFSEYSFLGPTVLGISFDWLDKLFSSEIKDFDFVSSSGDNLF